MLTHYSYNDWNFKIYTIYIYMLSSNSIISYISFQRKLDTKMIAWKAQLLKKFNEWIVRSFKLVELTLRFLRSISKRALRPGRCTLTTISCPFNFPRWTWPAWWAIDTLISFSVASTIHTNEWVKRVMALIARLITITKTSSSYWLKVEGIKNIIDRSSKLFLNNWQSSLWWKRRNLILHEM